MSVTIPPLSNTETLECHSERIAISGLQRLTLDSYQNPKLGPPLLLAFPPCLAANSWSDSNPNLRGATINLHAAAKPLMKLLYHKQASDFIRNKRDIPLSAKDAQIYGSYLSYEYVSPSTKGVILDDILRRADFECEALAVDSNLLHNLIQLLEAPVQVDTRISHNIRRILVTLANREVAAAATCSSLVAALCNSRVPQIVGGLLSVLSEVADIKFPPVTSGASVEAKLLDHIVDMFEAPDTPEEHCSWIFQIVSNLVVRESSAVAVVEANIFKSVDKLLRSPPTDLHLHIYFILENLASHESTAMAVLRMLPFDLLETLWRKSVDGTTPIDPLATGWWPCKPRRQSSVWSILLYTSFTKFYGGSDSKNTRETIFNSQNCAIDSEAVSIPQFLI
ncbi:hypothetical protein C8J57DRAFT_1678739 [Mycena rebaudengoi]|nr:hypothetical protein C8J57DRAFT_1678739 [Mycena rebaudengoi]